LKYNESGIYKGQVSVIDDINTLNVPGKRLII
jgi:hypothetical protein